MTHHLGPKQLLESWFGDKFMLESTKSDKGVQQLRVKSEALEICPNTHKENKGSAEWAKPS